MLECDGVVKRQGEDVVWTGHCLGRHAPPQQHSAHTGPPTTSSTTLNSLAHTTHTLHHSHIYILPRADPGGPGGSMPPPVVSVCNIFRAWLLAFRHTTQLTCTSKLFVNRIAEGVGIITPPLPNPNLGSATLQLQV